VVVVLVAAAAMVGVGLFVKVTDQMFRMACGGM